MKKPVKYERIIVVPISLGRALLIAKWMCPDGGTVVFRMRVSARQTIARAFKRIEERARKYFSKASK